MSYIVLARKWRPKRFDDLVGQEHVGRTLRNAIRIGRLAHAFLFTGVRGVGKTSAARILAMALNCEKSDGPTEDPCGTCPSCSRIVDATSIDVQEIDGASNNSVDDVRHLRETVAFQPSHSRVKVYIIDEVHMLSTSAFNALLKTLEEPPPHVKFIFATTEPHRIPVTILSRCQRYDFRRIPPGRIAAHIEKVLEAESISMEPEALAMVAKEAQGSMRDALSLLDQILAAFGNEVKLDDVSWLIGVADHRVHADLTRAVLERNPGDCLEIIGRLDRDGYNLPHFMTGYLEHVRDLIVVKSAGSDAPGASIPEWESDELEKAVKDTSLPELYRIFSHVARAADEVARSPMPRILLETTFLKLAQNEPLTTISRLLQALGDIKRTGGMPAAGGTSGGGPSGEPPERRRRPEAGRSKKGGKKKSAPQETTAHEASPDAWGRIVEEAGSIKPFLMGVLTKATPIKVDTGEVVIGFDAESEFDSSFANEKDNLRAIENACAKVLGDRPRVLIEDNSSEANAARTARIDRQRKETEELREDALVNPVIKEARELFGADIRDIKTDVE
jgi:DNA polymerase-3 subunit gamma/tau